MSKRIDMPSVTEPYGEPLNETPYRFVIVRRGDEQAGCSIVSPDVDGAAWLRGALADAFHVGRRLAVDEVAQWVGDAVETWRDTAQTLADTHVDDTPASAERVGFAAGRLSAYEAVLQRLSETETR